MTRRVVQIYGPEIRVFSSRESPRRVRVMFSKYEPEHDTSAIVMVVFETPWAKRWIEEVRAWLIKTAHDPERELILKHAGVDCHRRDEPVMVHVTFPRGQVSAIVRDVGDAL